MDSFCESMDSFRIVVTNPDSKKIRFVSCHESWLHRFANPNLKDSNRGFVSWPELPKIRPVFTNPTNPHESLRILSTIPRNESLRIHAGGFANLWSQDSWHDTKRIFLESGFVTTIRNESMDSQNESTFLRISYTNPASLITIQYDTKVRMQKIILSNFIINSYD